MMDEYLVLAPDGPRLCPTDAHYSCRGYGRRVILVMTGAEKRAAVSHLRHCADFTPDWPASFIFRCRNPTVFVDRFANPAG